MCWHIHPSGVSNTAMTLTPSEIQSITPSTSAKRLRLQCSRMHPGSTHPDRGRYDLSTRRIGVLASRSISSSPLSIRCISKTFTGPLCRSPSKMENRKVMLLTAASTGVCSSSRRPPITSENAPSSDHACVQSGMSQQARCGPHRGSSAFAVVPSADRPGNGRSICTSGSVPNCSPSKVV